MTTPAAARSATTNCNQMLAYALKCKHMLLRDQPKTSSTRQYARQRALLKLFSTQQRLIACTRHDEAHYVVNSQLAEIATQGHQETPNHLLSMNKLPALASEWRFAKTASPPALLQTDLPKDEELSCCMAELESLRDSLIAISICASSSRGMLVLPDTLYVATSFST